MNVFPLPAAPLNEAARLRENVRAIRVQHSRKMAVQMKDENGEIIREFKPGDFAQVHQWLRENPKATAWICAAPCPGFAWIRPAPCPDFIPWSEPVHAVPLPADEPPPEQALSKPAPEMAAVLLQTVTAPERALSEAVTTAPHGPSVVMVRASDIRPEKIQWLWPNRFALGKFSLIAGNPGLGKSQLTIHIATQVTTGGRWPNGEGAASFGSVVILSCEDDPADTLVPRLIAAGADVSRVHIVEAVKISTGTNTQERQFDLANDVQALCRAIDVIGDVRLVVIDPITAYLGTGKNVDSHKNAEVRAALAPLQIYASKLGFAAVGVTHLNKGGGTEALMRVLGSLGFVAAARVAFLVVGDAGNERTLFIPMKNNIGAKQPGLAFRIVPKAIAGGIETSAIEWDNDEVTTSADEALAAAAGRDGENDSDKSSLGEAMNFLRDVLAEGPIAAKTVEHQAKEAGITRATLRRAKGKLGVKAHHRGDGGTGGRGEWIWEMPEQITFGQPNIGD